jgi:transcriptional activator SPT7
MPVIQSLTDHNSNGVVDRRVRKRTRFTTQSPRPSNLGEDITDLWWQAVTSDALIANGVPNIPYASSRLSARAARSTSSSKTARGLPKVKLKESKTSKDTIPSHSSQSLLGIMNTNIRTMKRVRWTHAKFAALNLNSNNEDSDWSSGPAVTIAEDEADDIIDERPWRRASGIEIGEETATDCMHWMGEKVLEHAGFQGRFRLHNVLLCCHRLKFCSYRDVQGGT